MNNTTITGNPATVAALRAYLAAGMPLVRPAGSPAAPSGVGAPAAVQQASGAACAGGCGTPVAGTTAAGGALATPSNCVTTGAVVRMCAPGSFPAYTNEDPLFVTKTPTRKDFDVPCAVAISYFADVATKCESANSIITSIEVGNPASGCNGTQVNSSTTGVNASIVMAAPPGCDVYTPGLLFTVGLSNNTSPGPISLSVQGIGSDGCAFEMDDIRVGMRLLGSGTLALLFGCVEEQRLYPVIGRLRTAVPLLPAGTVIPGLAALPTALNYPDETLQIQVTGPAGMTLTVETLAWNHPTLSCLWNNALGPMGL